MHLREHPEILRDSRNWPPRWQSVSGAPYVPRGEIGVLRSVFAEHDPRIPPCVCWLMAEHESYSYIAPLYFQDVPFYVRIVGMLKSYVGQTIVAIGNIEL